MCMKLSGKSVLSSAITLSRNVKKRSVVGSGSLEEEEQLV